MSEGEADSSPHGIRQSINFNKLSLLTEKKSGSTWLCATSPPIPVTVWAARLEVWHSCRIRGEFSMTVVEKHVHCLILFHQYNPTVFPCFLRTSVSFVILMRTAHPLHSVNMMKAGCEFIGTLLMPVGYFVFQNFTRPNFLGAACHHSAAPGEQLQFWGHCPWLKHILYSGSVCYSVCFQTVQARGTIIMMVSIVIQQP